MLTELYISKIVFIFGQQHWLRFDYLLLVSDLKLAVLVEIAHLLEQVVNEDPEVRVILHPLS